MKGQISLELIIVIAVFLAVLSMWLGGVNKATANIGLALGHQQAELAAKKLATAINSICVMGHGNKMEIEVYVPGKANITNNGMHWNNHTFEKTIYCDFNNLTITRKQLLTIVNNRGVITIS